MFNKILNWSVTSVNFPVFQIWKSLISAFLIKEHTGVKTTSHNYHSATMDLSQSKPKVFVTGASGLLGRKIMEEASHQDFITIGIAYSRVQKDLLRCDLTKPGEVEKLIEEAKPEFIVHAAAERFPNKVENNFEAAKDLNIETSRRLAQIAKTTRSKLIYISTDYVFDGTNPPYKETDVPNPLNKYGLTKYEGEKAVIEANPDASILRIPVLYGPIEKLGESAVTCLLESLLDKKEKSISHYEKRYPSHTQDIARIICALIKALQKDPSLKGVFQWSGKERLTKYDMVRVMAEVFSLPHDHIKPDTELPSQAAPRPYDAQLDSSRLENLGINFHTDFKDGIKECLQPWVTNEVKVTS